MLASSLETDCSTDVSCESVGNQGYLQRHNAQMFEEGRSFSGNERDKLFLNRGDGTFADLSDLSGCDSPNDGRATIGCDFDDDGDVDLFVHELQRERHGLYRNDVGTRYGGFLKLRLRATTGQWEAVGATVIVEGPAGPVAQVLSRGAGFVSCQAPELIFGLGDLDKAQVQVLWPGGALETFGPLDANSRSLLVEGSGQASPIASLETRLPDPLPPGLKVQVGAQVPVLALTDVSGAERTIDPVQQASGDRLYINLWASYCAPCVGELPYLREVNERSGSTVICLSVDAPAQREQAAGLLAGRGAGLAGYYLPDPLVEGAAILDLLDLDRLPIPTTLVLDGQGRIEGIVQGPLDKSDHPWR